MKRLFVIWVLAACLLTGCTKNPREGGGNEGVTVCGVLTDDQHQPLNNAFIELHSSAKDPTVIQSRYQVGRTDGKGQFDVEGVRHGQYWMAVIPKGACNPKSKEENESRRVQVNVPNGTAGSECKTHWQVVQDASCKVSVE